MLGLMVPIILSLAASTKAYRDFPRQSAASSAQLRFAIENKYDDTGPGAKEPQYAYHTYKNLDDALIAYLDDPDTKLPEQERQRAVQKLTQTSQSYGQIGQKLQRFYPKTVEEYTGYIQQPQAKPNLVLTKLNLPKKYIVPYDFQGSLKDVPREREATPYRLQRFQAVKGNPLSVAHYSRDSDLLNSYGQFNSHPKYAFSYGVNVPETGDHKSAHEEREGGSVRGYYSFLDADGLQRTVRYTADDKLGFQATVQRD